MKHAQNSLTKEDKRRLEESLLSYHFHFTFLRKPVTDLP